MAIAARILVLIGCWSIFYDDEIAVLIVVTIMSRCPDRSANIAKLISTPTSHVVASLVLFNYELALYTLPIVQITLEK